MGTMASPGHGGSSRRDLGSMPPHRPIPIGHQLLRQTAVAQELSWARTGLLNLSVTHCFRAYFGRRSSAPNDWPGLGSWRPWFMTASTPTAIAVCSARWLAHR